MYIRKVIGSDVDDGRSKAIEEFEERERMKRRAKARDRKTLSGKALMDRIAYERRLMETGQL